MRLIDLMKIRDLSIKTRLLNAENIEFREAYRSKYDALIEQANRDWKNNLVAMFGEKQAEEIINSDV